ncbi:hypothetical protein AL036_22600 [Salipiger aestuarii]|uniref:Uncharacterized protein n=1 Tax=Salipiger aestuarii TaxID=568098 RepID=A0A327XKN4_9RHOB|nr:hypothetical protein AL036_22600 [Salipiger aestuarii]KAA8605258.1 hypothetical protein AL037_21480 [Salipiger aestuarii]KAB2530324.1 hypothetical protein AL035_22015 [Salipiger aestuarii]RAK06669.1 hypothetical protein ATI53_11251 [Salipiger aestuarii]
MVGPTMTTDTSSYATHAPEIVCIRIGEYSLVQGELIWEQNGVACVRHRNRLVVGRRVEAIRRSQLQ